jgi:glutaconate CoA-transferase subunit B
MTATGGPTSNEIMVAAIARNLRDGELGFVGVGTAGRAYTLAVGIPVAATRLAQMTHAPGFTIYWGNLLSPDLDYVPANGLQDSFTRWPGAAALPDTGFKIDMVTRGCFDVCFDSAAQIDRYGNLNITLIGPAERPRVRLVGCLAQPEHLAFVRRPIIVLDLDPRTFVEEVDFITSVGHRSRGRSRAELGLTGPGPQLVVTNKAVFDFDPHSKVMRVVSVHPGVTLEQVRAELGFAPVIPDRVATTEPPTAEDLRLIRERIDPNRILLRA